MIERPQKPWVNGIHTIPGIFKWMGHNL